ncbi:ATP-binding protein [Candidatus Nitrosocosmicus hydrocola]|uniref:ATP-binding protein n=1 Tax=Candidatus Nitrosocosmicus hydrocola TaxID=1826872 RepID=UPI0011E58E7D|nr:ATP-binding protein [Candidatus Nitrosocosmicus hydrocola]
MDRNEHIDDIVDKLSTDQRSNSSEPFSNSHNRDNLKDSIKDHPNPQTVVKVANEKETIRIFTQFASNCKSKLIFYTDKKGPSVIINVPEIYENYRMLKSRSVKIKIITEVTKDNLRYCNQIIKEFDAEIRHINNIKGTFVISDEKVYFASSVLQDSKSLNEIIYSDVKGIVQQNQSVFELIWKKAISAEQRIKEIEEGLSPIETRIVDNPGEIYSLILDITSKSNNGLSNCSTIGGFQMIYEDKNLFHAYVNLLSRYNEGGKVKGSVRWVTHIENNSDQITLINNFLNIGIEIRHVKNLPPMSFALSDKQFQATIEKMEKGDIFRNVLYSTEPLYIKHFQHFFENLWNSGIDVRERIRQIESGIAPEMTQIIEDSDESRKLLLHLLKSAKDEILIVYPSSKAVDLQKRIGVIDILHRKSRQGLKIRIISPRNLNLEQLIIPSHFKSDSLISKNILIREILKQHDFKPTIVMIDRKHVLALELKDDTMTTFEKATGLTTYSISSPTVLSYISIFDSFWEQTDTSIRLGVANEKLIASEQLEREFINAAAHELRTPTQAIMGYTELDEEIFSDVFKILDSSKNEELKRNIIHLHKHFDTVSKNASRLNELINNLLDVARIESNRIDKLSLDTQKVELVGEINDSIKTQLDQKIKNKNIQIDFINDSLQDHIWVYADKSRLNQIINNLIDNAIKFSKQNGRISIIIEGNVSNANEEDHADNVGRDKNEKKEVYVSISDTGKGISPQVLPRLFEKFVTNSDTGTGLGLYITRNLVEAHGGRIWAYNNNDGVGSTFIFSLPKFEDSI